MISEVGIEGRVFDVFGCVIWASFLRATAVCQLKVHFRDGSDTYRWGWPVEEDRSVADCFVALDYEPDAESEEEGEGDDRVDGRLWV